MKNIGIFYATNTGVSEDITSKIAKGLNISKDNIFDVARQPISKIADYDVVILGSGTTGYGEILDDWNLAELEKLNLTGKKVAVFGAGDSESYPDTFCNAMGLLAEAVEKTGATLIGNKVSTEGYNFDESVADKDGCFCGLAIDDDNESEKTDERIATWIAQIKPEIE